MAAGTQPLLQSRRTQYRPRQEKEQQNRQCHSQQQEQKFFKLNLSPVALDGQLEIMHWRPVHPAEPSAVQQVNDKGDDAQQRSPDQEWAQEGHDVYRAP